MKKIIVDLDIVTVANWDKKGEPARLAQKFINRIENNEFQVVTPFIMIELLTRWKYSELVSTIQQFYLTNTTGFITNEDFDKKLESLKINDEKILAELKASNVKGEDTVLVLITSLFEIDYLVTFNRKHLRGKKELINEVLTTNGVKTIEIVGPEEI